MLFSLIAPSRLASTCNRTLLSLFLKEGKTKVIGDPSPNETINKVCGNPSEAPSNYCCSLEEFKELYLQFNTAKAMLVRTRAKVKKFFDFYRNLQESEVKRVVDLIKNQPSVRKCVGNSYSVVTSDINKRNLIVMLKNLNEFIDWKIEQLSSIVCLVCSPLHSNYTIVSPIEVTLFVNLSQCSTDFQQYGNLDNVAYFLDYMFTLIRGIQCSRGIPLSFELQNLPDLSNWKSITEARGKCLDPRNNGHADPKCEEAFQGVSNMILFPQYERLNFMSEYALEAFQEYYGNDVKMIPDEQRIKTVTTDEEMVLRTETIEEKASWDFRAFKVYNADAKWPIRLSVSCNYTGVKWTKYKMNMEETSGFVSYLNQSIEKELQDKRNELSGNITNQYEASFLMEETSSRLVSSVLLLVISLLTSFKM